MDKELLLKDCLNELRFTISRIEAFDETDCDDDLEKELKRLWDMMQAIKEGALYLLKKAKKAQIETAQPKG
ncbi:MAG TPA: hypothetical protein VMX97_14405 [Hyphomicrobiaceae bacterium]|nr:hypothetical protein [Hyphomicrobiaceae bacterium]